MQTCVVLSSHRFFLIRMTCKAYETAFLDAINLFLFFSCSPIPSSVCSVLHGVNPS